MKITVKFWTLVQFLAEKEGKAAVSLFKRLKQDPAVAIVGTRNHKMATIDLPREDVEKLQLQAINQKVRRCDCGELATSRNRYREWVCQRCKRMESQGSKAYAKQSRDWRDEMQHDFA